MWEKINTDTSFFLIKACMKNYEETFARKELQNRLLTSLKRLNASVHV